MRANLRINSQRIGPSRRQVRALQASLILRHTAGQKGHRPCPLLTSCCPCDWDLTHDRPYLPRQACQPNLSPSTSRSHLHLFHQRVTRSKKSPAIPPTERHKVRIAKSQWPWWPRAGLQPFRCRTRRVFRFAGRKTKSQSLAIFGFTFKFAGSSQRPRSPPNYPICCKPVVAREGSPHDNRWPCETGTLAAFPRGFSALGDLSRGLGYSKVLCKVPFSLSRGKASSLRWIYLPCKAFGLDLAKPTERKPDWDGQQSVTTCPDRLVGILCMTLMTIHGVS